MKTFNFKSLALLLGIFLIFGCTESKKETVNSESTTSQTADNPEKGIIYAEPEDISSNLPLEEVLRISNFFNQPENKVKIQFPSKEADYAWVHMSKFYPTTQIMSQGQESVLPYDIDPSISELAYTNENGEQVSVNQHFDTKPIDAMVVVKDGEIIYERYNTMRPEDKHIWYSCSKVSGSTLLAMLEHQGKIDVSKFVSDYLPELKGSVWETVKLEEALDMATGLNGTEHDEPNPTSRTDPDEIWYRWAATEAVGLVPDVRGRNESWVDVMRDMERKTPGHEVFEYNSINTFICNRVVERVANRPLSELFSEQIWSKLGMEHDAYYLVSPSGNTLGFLGINSTLRDMARFAMMFTPSCKQIAGEQIIPDAVMDKIQDKTYVGMYDKGFVGKKMTGLFSDDAGKIANRYQWDAVLSDGDMYKGGVGGQGIYISPKSNMVVAWFSTGDGNNEEETLARAIVKSFED